MGGLDVLAVAAHPDDAEVGVGGALILAADAGRRVGIVDLTRGEAGTRGTVGERQHESERAGKLLGLHTRSTLGWPDGEVGTRPEHRLALVELLRDLRPRVVLAPYPQDRHPDHAAAGRLVREACFLSRVAKIGDGAPHTVDRLYHYMLHEPFTPSFVVDVSSVWERKMEALTAYESQFGAGSPDAVTEIGNPWFLRYLEARAIVHGAMVGARYGEPYHHLGPALADGLPGLAPPPDGPRPYNMFF
ncbi:MAG TPA: bacillithiol biosynthesis deacetylase BshB1 [Nitriliruptorales bacterium]